MGFPDGTRRDYSINCQSCVVVNEARRRGYDVQALGNQGVSGSTVENLSMNTNLAWIDRGSGQKAISKIAGGYLRDEDGRLVLNSKWQPKSKSYAVMIQEFNDLTKEEGRYTLYFAWKGRGSYGHIITAERLSNGVLRGYDPQVGKIVNLDAYLKDIKVSYGIGVLKVNDLDFNIDVIVDIMKRS